MADEDNRLAMKPTYRSLLGETSEGAPLSINRAPAPELSPWIARVYATDVRMEPDQVIESCILYDTSALRVLLEGDLFFDTRDGPQEYKRCALYFGPQSKRMRTRVKGSFATVSLALKPGAANTLKGPTPIESLDRIIPYDSLYDEEWCRDDVMLNWFDRADPPEKWMRITEKLFAQLLEYSGAQPPDPIIAAFDRAAFADPNLSINEFAEQHHISVRQLERVIKAAFGLTPKHVLRRARVLDMAAHLRGVADDEEAAELALRYYDQSHLNREFMFFFGMTPTQLARTPLPFLTLALEMRQSRRLEVLGRNHPGTLPPWRR